MHLEFNLEELGVSLMRLFDGSYDYKREDIVMLS